MIKESEIKMLPLFSPIATQLIQALLDKTPENRLGHGVDGIKNIKNHEFFNSIDWDLLLQKKLEPLFRPKVENNIDLSNIDRHFTKEEASETPTDNTSILKKENFE